MYRLFQLEVGGMNALRPMITATHYDTVTVDADYMGRAYPRIYHMTSFSMKSFHFNLGYR